jgi:2-methylcitrate dehydratase PrpD
MPARVAIRLRDGRTLSREVVEYPGLNGSLATWEDVLRKFHQLSGDRLNREERDAIVDVVQDLEHRRATDLTRVLANIDAPGDWPASGGPRVGEESGHESHI